jgi:hypothetical protein
METTVLDRPSRWTERGRWRSITAELTLRFQPRPAGCAVAAEVVGAGLGPVGFVLTRLAPYAVHADLGRAARILSERAPGH